MIDIQKLGKWNAPLSGNIPLPGNVPGSGEYASSPDYIKMMQQLFGGGGTTTQPTAPAQQPSMELFDFPYPEQWRTATDIYNMFSKTGLPTSYSDWYQQSKGVASRDIEEAIKQASEQAGIGGLRWSTPLGQQTADIAGRRMGELGTDWLGRELGAGEAARQRQLSAAGGLTGLGSLWAQLPMDVSGQMMNMGQIMQQQRMAEFLRTLPENSPWLQYAMQAYGGRQPQGYPMYQQGFGSQMMDIGTMMAMMMSLFGGGKRGGVSQWAG